jgi:hypothetical protein
MVTASRWARTRHVSVGGEEPRDMMEYVGQWLYVVGTVLMCVLAMWSLQFWGVHNFV